MKRAATAFVVLALGLAAATAAAALSHPSVHLSAPSSVTGTQLYRVLASGDAPDGTMGVAVVLIWGGESCPNNYDAAKALTYHSIWGWKHGALPFKLVSGSYRVSTVGERWVGPPANGKNCAYLYGGTQRLSAPAKARTSRNIHLG
jgi:hypothetical protein